MAGTKANRFTGKPDVGTTLVINHVMVDGTAAATVDQTIALPFNVVVLSCYVSVETTLAKHATNVVELAVGDGTNDILRADSDSDLDDAAFTADTPRALAHYDGTYNLIAAGDAIHFIKTHGGTPANTLGYIEFTLIVQVT